jgi:hypothetical protein
MVFIVFLKTPTIVFQLNAKVEVNKNAININFGTD